MPEFRCCLFVLARLNLVLAAPCTGKKRFFAPECDLSFNLGTDGRGAIKAAEDVCRGAGCTAAVRHIAAKDGRQVPRPSMLRQADGRAHRQGLHHVTRMHRCPTMEQQAC
mgnify:CR=1 FL=1